MSIKRMSFKETPDILNAIGFQVKLSFDFRSDTAGNYIIIKKGSLIYGFKDDDEVTTHGFLYDNNVELLIEANPGTYYITCDKKGLLKIDLGNFNNLKGISENIPGIPWYTFKERALVGKVLQPYGFISGFIACDDAYWCEYEDNLEDNL